MRDLVRLVVIAVVSTMAMGGWAVGGYIGAGIGAALGVLIGVMRWRGEPLWSWLDFYLGRNRPFTLVRPVTAVNDRSGGGVRYQDGIAVTAVQILGKPHQATYFTGSTATQTANSLDVSDLIPLMRQSLGLSLDSISVISAGTRRRPAGDYPRVYDTLVGTPPYAGQRETWLVLRIGALDNGEALRCRSTVGAASVAAAQHVAMALRCKGIRAKVATAVDISELERRLGRSALDQHNRRWNSVRGDSGWQTTYAYRPSDITADTLAQAWSLRADGITQNITVSRNGRVSATVTVRTAQPPTASPSVVLQPLPGQQWQAAAACLCVPRPRLSRVRGGPMPASLMVPVGPSGVLLGRTANGDRLAIPIGDPGEPSRVHIAADDAIAKRIIIRAAATGERITMHTNDLQRWETVRMPCVAVIEHPRPASGSTVSVTDGSVPPAPRPATIISVGGAGAGVPSPVDVLVTQTGPDTVEVTAAGQTHQVQMEFFRAENLYVSRAPAEFDVRATELEFAE